MKIEVIKNKFNIGEWVVGIHPLYNLIPAKVINVIPHLNRYAYEVEVKWQGIAKKIIVQEIQLAKHK